jgi:hypothetical protein
VFSSKIVPLKTALTTSAAPAKARKSSVSANENNVRPASVIATPQAATATSTARP